MHDGHVSHFVLTKKPKKTNKRNRYGKIYNPPKRDVVKINKMQHHFQEETYEIK